MLPKLSICPEQSEEHVDNTFRWENDFNGQAFSISYIDFLENATEGLVLDETGERYLKIVEAGDGNRHDHYLKEGDIANIHNILFTLNRPQEGAINIILDKGVYTINSPFSGQFMRMGFGFGKSIEHNYTLFKHLQQFKRLGYPILIGVSRKSMIYNFLETTAEHALNGTTALNAFALDRGAQILRVHDVKEAKECVDLWRALQ